MSVQDIKMQVRRNPHTEVPQFDHIKALSGRRQWPGGDLFYTVKGSGVSFMFFMWFSIIILSFFFFNTCMPCTDRDGCRAAETEAGGNEYFLDVNSWPQRKKSETEEKNCEFPMSFVNLSIAKYRTFPSCGVFLSAPCLTQPPGLNFFTAFPCGSAWLKSMVHGELLNPPPRIFSFHSVEVPICWFPPTHLFSLPMFLR